MGRTRVADRYPPGPGNSLLQATLSTIQQQQDRLGFLIAMSKAYGELCHFRTGLRHIYLVVHPDYVKIALAEQADRFHKTRPFKHALERFLGQGLFVLDGDEHRRERRLVQPAFHHARVEAYATVMVEHTQRLIDGWESGQENDIAREMTKLTAGIVAKTLFDADVSKDTEAITQGIVTLQEAAIRQMRFVVRAPSWLPTPQKRKEQRALRSLDEIVLRIIEERRAAGDDKGDLLSMLLLAKDEDGRSRSVQQVRDEVLTLFVAGHETTANTLTWAWYLLGRHPEAVAKLYQEVGEVVGGRALMVQDVERLPYTNMIINETLRLFPPAWMIAREAIADVAIGGYTLPAGSIVVTSAYITHRNPRYFPTPEQFRPERFAPGFEQSLPRFTYFPFGGGPRICIGQSFATLEAILILATLAQRCRLTLVPGQQIVMEPLITLRAKYGIRISVTKNA